MSPAKHPAHAASMAHAAAAPQPAASYSPQFNAAVTLVLEEEGYLSEDSRDPGGTTAYGISQAAHPDIDVKNLTRDGAIRLYWERYWLKFHCDRLPYALAAVVFDGVVQHGELGVQLLQRAVHVGEDGIIGSRTVTAIERQPLLNVIAVYMAHRVTDIYVELDNWDVYRVGWMKRLFEQTAHAYCNHDF
jgi:lysozyme family protein